MSLFLFGFVRGRPDELRPAIIAASQQAGLSVLCDQEIGQPIVFRMLRERGIDIRRGVSVLFVAHNESNTSDDLIDPYDVPLEMRSRFAASLTAWAEAVRTIARPEEIRIFMTEGYDIPSGFKTLVAAPTSASEVLREAIETGGQEGASIEIIINC